MVWEDGGREAPSYPIAPNLPRCARNVIEKIGDSNPDIPAITVQSSKCV